MSGAIAPHDYEHAPHEGMCGDECDICRVPKSLHNDKGQYVVIAGADYESLKVIGEHDTITQALAQYEQIKDDPQYKYKDVEHRFPEER